MFQRKKILWIPNEAKIIVLITVLRETSRIHFRKWPNHLKTNQIYYQAHFEALLWRSFGRKEKNRQTFRGSQFPFSFPFLAYFLRLWADNWCLCTGRCSSVAVIISKVIKLGKTTSGALAEDEILCTVRRRAKRKQNSFTGSDLFCVLYVSLRFVFVKCFFSFPFHALSTRTYLHANSFTLHNDVWRSARFADETPSTAAASTKRHRHRPNRAAPKRLCVILKEISIFYPRQTIHILEFILYSLGCKAK